MLETQKIIEELVSYKCWTTVVAQWLNTHLVNPRSRVRVQRLPLEPGANTIKLFTAVIYAFS